MIPCFYVTVKRDLSDRPERGQDRAAKRCLDRREGLPGRHPPHGPTVPCISLSCERRRRLFVERKPTRADPRGTKTRVKLACHIAYASPKEDADYERWVDKDPRYGPYCLVSQKPFVMEPLDSASPAWGEYKAWRSWRQGRAEHFGRKAAWDAAQHAFQELRIERRV
jgi:hypothetical protein